MAKITKIVLDVLKPHEPPILDLVPRLSELKGVAEASAVIQNIEKRIEEVKITIEGSDIDFEKVKKVIVDSGATIRSVDGVWAGKTEEK